MNKIILAVLFAGFGAQLIKLLALLFKHKTLHWKDLFVTGGMPSSHSAFVVALATIIFLEDGITTPFAISLVFAMIVLRDAYGVRRTVGEEGLIIQQLIKKLKMKKKTHFAMGHTPKQVIVGSLIGFVVAYVVYYLF